MVARETPPCDAPGLFSAYGIRTLVADRRDSSRGCSRPELKGVVLLCLVEFHRGDSDPGSVFHFHEVFLRSLAVVRSQSDHGFGEFLRMRFFFQEAESTTKK